MTPIEGQPVLPEANVEPQIEAGTEALQTPEAAPLEAPPTTRFQWGRESVEIPSHVIHSTAEAFGKSPEAVQTWIQMGRDAANVYSETRRQAAEVARREASIAAREKAIEERMAQLESRPTAQRSRPEITQDPVGFWNDVASRLDSLPTADRMERMEKMIVETREQIAARREAEDQAAQDREFYRAHEALMEEKKRNGLPVVDLQTIASTLDRFVTEIPDGIDVRDLLEMGYRIVSWDTVGQRRAQQEAERLRQPRARVMVPASQGAPEPPQGAPANETLDQRRARLHRQVGGMTVGQWNDMREG